MTREAIIKKTIKAINQLPEDKAEEISNFADFLIKRHEEILLSEGMKQLSNQGQTFQFLNDDEELYSLEDLKVKYNG